MPTQGSSSDPNRGFAIFISALALVVSMAALLAVAFKLNDMQEAAPTGARQVALTSPAGAIEEVKLVIKSDEEHGRKGPEGKWHDAFLPADFTVRPGATVKVTVLNYDEGQHSFTSPGLGTEATIAAGSESSPMATTFTFTAPRKAGSYLWFCALPCDPWAMSRSGYMRGHVTVS